MQTRSSAAAILHNPASTTYPTMSAGPQRQHTSQEVAEVLQLVVQHCPDASNMKTLCCLLEVNRPVQAAVRAALGHCSLTMPSIARPEGSFSTARLAEACSWLPRNAGLIRHLHFGDPLLFFDDDSNTPPASCRDTAPHLMTLALQLCATQAQTAAVVAAAAAAAPQHQLLHGAAAEAAAAAAPSLPWQLRSANIHWLASAPMLLALAACTSLTALQLELRPSAGSDSALFRALGSMQHLATLNVRVTAANLVPLTHSAWLQQLTRLRQLELSNDLRADGFPDLPSSLQHLTAVAGLDGEEESPKVISMSQLVHLQDLQLCVQGVLDASSVLPPHITRLQVMGEEGDLLPTLHGLQQLQELYVHAGDECLPFLQHLSRLRSLRAVNVGVDYCDLHEDILPGQPGQLERLLAGVAAAPQITKLVLADRSAGHSGEPYPSPRSLFGVQLHPHLLRLTALRHLDIACLDVQPEDAVHWTALKTLTALHLYNAWNLGDVAVAAIAVSLAGSLRVLELIDCGLDSPVLWPAVGACTSLESLCIDSAPNNLLRLDGSTLHLLTNLSRLTSLTGPEVRGMTAGAFAAFCAEVLPALVVKPDVFL